MVVDASSIQPLTTQVRVHSLFKLTWTLTMESRGMFSSTKLWLLTNRLNTSGPCVSSRGELFSDQKGSKVHLVDG